MGKKNYSCESSDSCSLVSITGISANSSCSESYSSTGNGNLRNKHKNKSCSSSSNSSNSSPSSISNSKKSNSSYSTNSSYSSNSSNTTNSSTEQTYSDCTTNRTTDTYSTSCSSTYTSTSCPIKNCDNSCVSIHSSECEKQNNKKCEKLVKKYTCAKEELLAFKDIILALNFIKTKLISVQPNINLRHVEKYCVEENIRWLECFVDTLFCVLRKNESYKAITLKEYKLKNDSEIIADNRTYLMKIKYNSKSGETCKNIPLFFKWSQLTNNDAKSYKAILNYVIKDIDEYIKGFEAASTIPFL